MQKNLVEVESSRLCRRIGKRRCLLTRYALVSNSWATPETKPKRKYVEICAIVQHIPTTLRVLTGKQIIVLAWLRILDYKKLGLTFLKWSWKAYAMSFRSTPKREQSGVDKSWTFLILDFMWWLLVGDRQQYPTIEVLLLSNICLKIANPRTTILRDPLLKSYDWTLQGDSVSNHIPRGYVNVDP